MLAHHLVRDRPAGERHDDHLAPRGVDRLAHGLRHLVRLARGVAHAALPVAHGRWGEDGELQGLLASWGLRVVGCGVTPSAVCFDKRVAKTLLCAAGLPVVSSDLPEVRQLVLQPVLAAPGGVAVTGARIALGHAYGGGSQYYSMWVVGAEKPTN